MRSSVSPTCRPRPRPTRRANGACVSRSPLRIGRLALQALDALGEQQKKDEEWRYLRARVLRKLDRAGEADPLLATLAGEANFYGFLAADWTDRPYAICATNLASDRAAEQRLLDDYGLARAFEWRALGEGREARREWDYILGRLAPEQRRLAADLAYREGWYDRAVFALNKGEELRFYEQRFRSRENRRSGAPHTTPDSIRPDLRDHPRRKRLGRRRAFERRRLWPHAIAAGNSARASRREPASPTAAPRTSITATRTSHSARAACHRWPVATTGAPWLASAAYNAGPGAVERWLGQRGQLEPDFFIASIPYKETREYVARVLAFSVIYDWRMNGKALAVAARLPRYGQNYAAPDRDTPRKAVVCPTPVAGTAQSAPAAASPAPGA